ncbi:hypothetical protein EAE96_001298 [Botrytis aclada]|nr:hypothetical protein EAE96_001298 [Botrytis aclada]
MGGFAHLLCVNSGLRSVYDNLSPSRPVSRPILAKLTNLFCVCYTIRGTRHSELYHHHRKHGEFVRWGPHSISVNGTSALSSIYGPKANVKKSSWHNAFSSISIFSAVNKGVHARKRRVMSHAFSDQVIREIQPYVISAICAHPLAMVQSQKANHFLVLRICDTGLPT